MSKDSINRYALNKRHRNKSIVRTKRPVKYEGRARGKQSLRRISGTDSSILDDDFFDADEG